MRTHSTRAAFDLMLMLLIAHVAACGQQLELIHLKKLSSTVDSLPRIAHPTPAQVKINRDFALLDRSARESVHECRGRSEAGDQMSFERSITPISKGPLFLSFSFDEQIDCGGVHPWNYSYTATYDLRTGEQVDWAKYLTKVNVENVGVNPGQRQPFDLYGLQSQALEKLVSAGWKNNQQDPGCTGIIDPTGEYPTTFQLSPSLPRQGLSVIPANLGSADSNCGQEVVLGKSAMDTLGIPVDIQAALLAQP